jgi:UPF0716 protein FxsA
MANLDDRPRPRQHGGYSIDEVTLMAKWFLIGLLALITAEVMALLLAGAAMGLLPALTLLVATSLMGLVVLQWPGRARLQHMRVAVTQSGITGLEAGGDAFLTVSAGILLLVPGFVTDVLAVVLLLPPVRQWIAGRFRRFAQANQGGPAAVVDLDRNDWSQVPEHGLEHKPRRNDPS